MDFIGIVLLGVCILLFVIYLIKGEGVYRKKLAAYQQAKAQQGLKEEIESKPQDTNMDTHYVSPVPVYTTSFGRGCAALTIVPLLAFFVA